MKPIRTLIPALLLAVCGAGPARAALKSETVAYKQDTASLEGLLIYDTAGKKKKPGILLIPDWMGVSEQARSYGEKVAKLGYVVLVADIYGAGIRPKDPTEAGTLAGIYRSDRPLLQARARAGLDRLMQAAQVDTSRTAAMGYCFGGGAALELARSGANLDGVVSFHGNLNTPHPEQAKNIQGRVLVLHGADDPHVPPEQVDAFTKEMREAKLDWTLVQYGGAVHSFTNPGAGTDPSRGNAYNAKADRRSWEAMEDFYEEIFPVKSPK